MIRIWAASLAFTLAVSAHGLLLEAQPRANSKVSGPNVTIRLRFNSRIDVRRSRLTLFTPDSKPHPLPLSEKSGPDTLFAEAPGLGAGLHKVQWQVLAADGHITRGVVPFRVE
jgi:methionine-rich copper-binding protein CopC